MTGLTKLLSMNDIQIQTWLKKVDYKPLATALTAAGEEISQRVYRNMSTRAVEALKLEIERQRAAGVQETAVEKAVSLLEALMG